MQGTLKFTLEGPRWADIPAFVRDYCFRRDIELDMQVDKGWIFVKCYVKMKGDHDMMLRAKRDIIRTIEQYNA